MQANISRERHLPAPDHRRDFSQYVLLLLQAVLVPARQIHMAPTLLHIPFNEPGHRCDVAIPRPIRFLGVAVLTRPFHDLNHCAIHGSTSPKRFIRDALLHCTKWMNQNRSESGRADTSNRNPAKPLFQNSSPRTLMTLRTDRLFLGSGKLPGN